MNIDPVLIAEWDQVEAEIRHRTGNRSLDISSAYQEDGGPVLAAVLYDPGHMCVHQMVRFLQEHIEQIMLRNPDEFGELE